MRTKQTMLFLMLCFFACLSTAPAVGQDAFVPDYETSVPVQWADVPQTALIFQATLHSYDCTDFSFRQVMEDWVGSSDTCWFPGSAYVRTTHGLPFQGDSYVAWVWDNTYYDAIGWTDFAVIYYSTARAEQHLPMPCQATLFQQMSIDDGAFGWIPYAWNVQEAKIDPPYVCSSRSGVGACKIWP